MIPETKKCIKCGQVKGKDFFYTSTHKSYVYLKSSCKECDNSSKEYKKYKYNKCECGNKKLKKSTRCQDCRCEKNITLGDVKKKYGEGKRASLYSLVRLRARACSKHLTSCSKCGYDKHVEICHIKSISSFSDETLLNTINHESNLIALCPNCHWELDNLK